MTPDMIAEIRLTPEGVLVWPESADMDWQERLFRLGAGPEQAGAPAADRFWHGVARRFLFHFQQAAADFWSAEEFDGQTQAAGNFLLPAAAPELFPELIAGAPPIPGGEYLADGLPEVWDAMGRWLESALPRFSSPAGFMGEYAPLWQKVGRVYFHLAENKADENRPFAFLATYTTGLAPNGRPLHKPLGEALRHYSAARDKPTLLRLLTPVDNAAKTLPWVADMIASKQVYAATPFTPGQAWTFLKAVPDLKAAGLWVRIPDWWKKRPQAKVQIVLDPLRKTKMNAESLLTFDRRLILGNEELTEAELQKLLQSEGGLMFLKGRWVEVDKARLEEALDQWERIKGDVRDGALTFSQGMRLLAGMPEDFKSDTEPKTRLLRFTAGDRLNQLLSAMRDAPPVKGKPAGPLAVLRRKLRPYQVKGADWLSFMTSLGLGACLADDMGLGKTIQVLTLLTQIKAAHPHGKPSLLVLPASLLGNWRAEARKFAPHLALRFLHRAMDEDLNLDRMAKNPKKELADCDVAITTYAMLVRQDFLAEVEWNLVIADEAQAVKNPGTRQSKALKALKAHGRLALTGTPVENRLGDLWSLFDFLNPGLLGTRHAFTQYTGKLAKSGGDTAYAPLKRLISPYILRRLKTDRRVISDLPEKVESISFCPLSKKQIALYQKVVDNLAHQLKGDDSGGIVRRGQILQAILRLKQICNHPDQMSGAGGYIPRDSGKFERLGQICEELAQRQERVLIFTQFKEIIMPLAEMLGAIYGRPGLILHGGTRTAERQKRVDQFQKEDGPPFFILSLKAGGTGLNLTAAARVIHFDRWWNPAVENQATDRAFRIGQKRNVMVHKFVCTGTIEEKIHTIIEEKSKLAEQVVGGDGQIDLTRLSDQAVMDLVRMDISQQDLD
ncbi:DEAD/DEAH box helicase [Desulfosarcina sp. OttesenSCG-928-A07]|nr:DEAD/DEAH box helicase [Desulfosarcina sp. OttesenSCG-928-G17]MDL2328406.1 DEAD/DEAH box helicase [Desulfosarcina sp. OttesenSCG-928-A07]